MTLKKYTIPHSKHHTPSTLPPFLHSTETLRAHFSRFGLILDVYIPRDNYTKKVRGFAFVEFDSNAAVAAAVAAMDNTMLDGNQITCEQAKQKRKTPVEMMKSMDDGGGFRGGRGGNGGGASGRNYGGGASNYRDERPRDDWYHGRGRDERGDRRSDRCEFFRFRKE